METNYIKVLLRAANTKEEERKLSIEKVDRFLKKICKTEEIELNIVTHRSWVLLQKLNEELRVKKYDIQEFPEKHSLLIIQTWERNALTSCM
jgi:hypothetical protein